jgi:transglutaminase-like putative cysteine protease
MVLLFLLFPRLGPLWGMPADAAGRTGLSGTLRLGGVAELANDDSIALRVRFLGRRPDPQALYFRGPVLGSFNGTDWTPLRSAFGPANRLRADLVLQGRPLRYEMTVEPSRLAMLPLLEATPDEAGAAPHIEGWPAIFRADLLWQLERPLTERVRFEASAWTQFQHGPKQPRLGLRDWVSLPPGFNPRALQWASELRARPELANAEPRRLAQALLDHIRHGDYSYTLEPGPYGRNAIDEFWLDRKVGFCEHFAASFVVLMRAMDVPARIVTGYQGADPETPDGWFVVRQSNAHAWAEYWQEGLGWVRVDPTAAVAPERISRGRSLQPRPGLVAGALGSVSPELLADARQLWEQLNNRWNQSVLSYTRGRQFDLLRSLGFDAPDWQDLATLLIAVLATVAGAGALWAWWDRRRQDPWQRLQRRVQERLARLGVAVAAHHAPRTRAAQVRSALGERGEALARALETLDRQRYASAARSAPDRRWWQAFRAAARAASP